VIAGLHMTADLELTHPSLEFRKSCVHIALGMRCRRLEIDSTPGVRYLGVEIGDGFDRLSLSIQIVDLFGHPIEFLEERIG